MPWDPRGVVRFPSEGPGNQHPTPRARLRRTGPPATLAGAGAARALLGRGRRHAGALPRRAARGGPPRSRERPDRARPPPGARRLARAPRRGSEARRGRGAPAHAAVGKAHRHHRAGGLARRRDPAAAARRRAAPAASHRRGARPRGDVRVLAAAGRRAGARRRAPRQPPGAARGSAAPHPAPPAPPERPGAVGPRPRLARSGALAPAGGESRLERRASGLWASRVTLPVRGSYAQLRGFLGVLLTSMPTASIDALRFERKKAADTQLEAQVRVTLHTRPSGDTL